MSLHKPSFDSIVNSDPTLKMIYDAKIDPNLFFHQIDIKIAAAKIAMNKYIDLLILYNHV